MPGQTFIRSMLVVSLSFMSVICFAQNPTDSFPGDPGSFHVYTIQNMSFGSFTQGATGGTVVVSNTGVRSVTGTIVGLNIGNSYFHSIFEIEGPPGSIVSVFNGPDAVLTGSNGGSMSLHLTGSKPTSPFTTIVQPPSRTQINIGGTLTVGNAAASPPGNYTGAFYIIFNQE